VRRPWSGRLATVLALVVSAGCAVSPNPVRPDGLTDTFHVPHFLRPTLDLIDSDPTYASVPLLDRPAGEWIRLRVRGVDLDPSLSTAVPAACCNADQMVRWSTGWIPDARQPDEVRLAADILIEAVRRAEVRGRAPE
jgi:hypothetical protein